MKTGVGDVGVPVAVDGEAVRHVEQVLAERADDVAGVRIQDQDRVLGDQLSIRKSPIWFERA